MKQIYLSDLDDLALGAKVLGSGGGGDPSYKLMITKKIMERSGPISLIDVDALTGEGIVAPVATMGAPLVSFEKLPSGREFPSILSDVEEKTGKKIEALICAEIGGGNSLTPLMVAAQMGIPVIDGDLIGRAFPEIQMLTCNLTGVSAAPAVIGDAMGRTYFITGDDAKSMEQSCRKIVMQVGSSAAISLYWMNEGQAKKSVIRGSVSHAIEIGRRMREAKEANGETWEALLAYTGGKLLDSGIIVDNDHGIQGGFLKGNVKIKSAQGMISIAYQNEYLAVFREGIALASTPDIIVLLETDSGMPITSESLAYGLRVSVLAIPSPEIWKTDAGLKLVGPNVFGYDIDYQTIAINNK